MSRPCQRDDLEAVISIWSRWTVDSHGYGLDLLQEPPADVSDVELYHCDNCHLDGEPGYGVGSESIEAAWQRALDHLSAGQAAA
jgi:hypothetical protein